MRTEILRSKVLRALAFGIPAAAIYVGVKYMSGGLTDRDLWMALVVAIIAGVGSSLPWRSKPKEPSGIDNSPR